MARRLAGGLPGDVVAGPLNHTDGPLGVLVGGVRRSRQLHERHVAMFGMLLEPFSSWLDNDRRIRELRLQREAAEDGIVWLQVPIKSMLMDSKKGQRLADNCMHAAQVAEVDAMKRQESTPAQ